MTDEIKPEVKDNIFKRIGRGFKVMYMKIVNSNYVQNIKAEQETANPNEFLPTELMQSEPVPNEELPDKQVKKNGNGKKQRQEEKKEDEFTTDFSNLTKVDL